MILAIVLIFSVSILGYFLFDVTKSLASFVSSVLLMFLFNFLITKNNLQDHEFNTYFITEARYYESWSTWVDKTCTRTYSCNCDDKGQCQTCTETYDCSYCDENDARYILLDNFGHEYNIGKFEYGQYKKEWKNEKFTDLNRNIDFYHDCGKDGNLYSVSWNGNKNTSHIATKQIDYENKLKGNTSAFKFGKIDEEKFKKYELVDYPKIENYYQKSVIGSEKLKYGSALSKRLDFVNGVVGPDFKCKVFMFIYRNKDISYFNKQISYFEGGNRNEVLIFVNLDHANQIQDVIVKSWNDKQILQVNLREEILSLKSLGKIDELEQILISNIKDYFKWRNLIKILVI